MKRYIKKVLIFSVLFTSSFCLVVLANFLLCKSDGIKTPKHKRILFLGDSNMEYAINDSIYESGINLSASADSYFYSYLKLKEILSRSPEIDTVLLSFAPHNIFDNGWLFDDVHIHSHFSKYYPFTGWDDFVFLLSRNPSAVSSAFPTIIQASFKNIGKRLVGKKINYGGFQNLDRNILKEVQLKLKNGERLPFFRIPDNFKVSVEEELYLDKIISTCNKNKVKLYFVNTPKRFELLQYPKYGVDEFNKLYDSKYKDIDFLDFSTLKLPDDNHSDFVHLSRKGSANFSLLLKQEGLGNLYREYNSSKARSHTEMSR